MKGEENGVVVYEEGDFCVVFGNIHDNPELLEGGENDNG